MLTTDKAFYNTHIEGALRHSAHARADNPRFLDPFLCKLNEYHALTNGSTSIWLRMVCGAGTKAVAQQSADGTGDMFALP